MSKFSSNAQVMRPFTTKVSRVMTTNEANIKRRNEWERSENTWNHTHTYVYFKWMVQQ